MLAAQGEEMGETEVDMLEKVALEQVAVGMAQAEEGTAEGVAMAAR